MKAKVEGGTLSESTLGLLGNISDAGLRIESPLKNSHEHHVPNGGPGTFIYFQSAIQRASQDAIDRHRENPTGETFQEIDFGAYLYDVAFAGTMKVLVIDDQRTMRQMVAMIYQKIAFEYPGVTIDCYTALSGEQAIRMCREHRFHIITMDQQMSIDYCQSMMDEMSQSERPKGDIPKFVQFGSDKIINAKKRQAYFKDDKWIQDIQPGDGQLLGHEAIRQIRKEVQEENRPPVLIFNLTGNLLEADRLMFLEVGSSGMLPKPTKLEDFLNLIKKNMGLYISQGLLQLSDSRVVMDDGVFQIGTRFLRDDVEPEPVTTERGKLTVPWAGGATQRSAGAGQSGPVGVGPSPAS
jgi:CheY-like chemotaxis protein